MSSHNETADIAPLEQLSKQLTEAAEDIVTGTCQLPDPILQSMIEAVVKIYANRVQMADHTPENIGRIIAPLWKNHKLTQTDAIIFVDNLLKQIDIELFEVQMFRSIG